MMVNILGFVLCSVIIFFAGRKLTFYGDLLAGLTGMGRAWVGLILMAAVTSLPELMVGISSVSLVQSADLAVGDILGSCAFNLGILSLMDLFTPKDRPLFIDSSKSHVLAGAFGVMLISLVGLSIYLEMDLRITPFLGFSSLLFFLVYLTTVRALFRFRKLEGTDEPGANRNTELSLRQVIRRYALVALVIVATALCLPYFAEQIAIETGLGRTFTGTLFLAISTSLPEIAVSLAAIRSGATNLALGNLLGSNLFNVFILFLDDLFYTRGLLLKDASDLNLLSVFMVLLMTAVAITGFVFPSKTKKVAMSWDTFIIFGLYILNILLIFLFSQA